MSASEELIQDIQELKSLLEQSKRKKVRQFLINQITTLETKVGTQSEPRPAKPQQSNNTNLPAVFNLVPSYAWDQDKTKVTVYITLDDLKPDQCTAEFSNTLTSFDFKVFNVKGLNYRLVVDKLNHEIASGDYRLKDGKAVLTLVKNDKKTWTDLIYKEDKFKTDKMGAKEDPSAGLMGLMKKMYEDGDETMKQTIAKAWTETQNKQGGGGGMK